jgi:hypothetical protein
MLKAARRSEALHHPLPFLQRHMRILGSVCRRAAPQERNLSVISVLEEADRPNLALLQRFFNANLSAGIPSRSAECGWITLRDTHIRSPQATIGLQKSGDSHLTTRLLIVGGHGAKKKADIAILAVKAPFGPARSFRKFPGPSMP